jgi:hypothetical protein
MEDAVKKPSGCFFLTDKESAIDIPLGYGSQEKPRIQNGGSAGVE